MYMKVSVLTDSDVGVKFSHNLSAPLQTGYTVQGDTGEQWTQHSTPGQSHHMKEGHTHTQHRHDCLYICGFEQYLVSLPSAHCDCQGREDTVNVDGECERIQAYSADEAICYSSQHGFTKKKRNKPTHHILLNINP